MTTLYRNGIIVDENESSLHRDIIVENERIIDIRPTLESENTSGNLYRFDKVYELDGALVTSGLIDCHTHLVFGGNRADEWGQRLNGVPYAEIAKRGGGINTSVTATRNLSEDELYALAVPRLQALLAEGVTTIECKSGYGLNLESERKQLRVAQRLGENFPVNVIKTLLSAHTVPPEFSHNADGYIDLVCDDIMPTLFNEGLIDAVDIFIEHVGFNLAQAKRVFSAAQSLGLPIKGHTEQLSNMGGTALVAQFNGLSADHIEYLEESGVIAMQQNDTVATLLPLAFYFLGETQKPPIDLLREYGVTMAVATDFNPGTAPIASLRLAMNMACVQFGLTSAEVWSGVTSAAAKALGLSDTHGEIRVGQFADLCVWNATKPVEIIYELGNNPLAMRIYKGEVV